MYGVIALSRQPMNDNNIHKVEGDFFIAFDTVPPFIMITNTENSDHCFKILKEAGDNPKDQHLAEIVAEFSRMIFKNWMKYGDEMEVKNKYEFSFILRNNGLEC